MAHLFIREHRNWRVMPLDRPAIVLEPLADAPTPKDGVALLLRSRTADGDRWLVLSATPGAVWLNGSPLHDMRLLNDRDELRIARVGRVLFSNRRIAELEFRAGEPPLARGSVSGSPRRGSARRR